MRPGLIAALLLGAAGSALGALDPAAAYRTGPPAGHTGGFGEPTCTACHWPEPGAGGTLRLDVPAAYDPGATYDLAVILEDPTLAAAGFQLSARLADPATTAGGGTGRQAGRLAPADSTVQVITAGNGIEYASHSLPGTMVPKDGRARWVVRWTAPAEEGLVVFHAAANAANDDDSEFGDRIHTAEARSRSR